MFRKSVWLRQKEEEEFELFREGLMLRRQKYAAKLRRFLKQLELVYSFKNRSFPNDTKKTHFRLPFVPNMGYNLLYKIK